MSIKIHIDDQAAEALLEKRPEESAALRLAVMNEGCGCGGDIWFEMNWDLPQVDDLQIEEAGVRIILDLKSQEYLEKELFLHYTPEKDAFSLKSRNQIYLHHIHL
ncbi:Iron-sulphur cluster biosynthesis [Marininema mesophilum]|uniref:Iron-sulphur cluster biosynthesis n=1 Tax=Marininema mesophilum TaxID=1048340 RepID=A0A1H2QKN7_9BACL|nr:iron-sulfur cluster biosynthesis family protein [Marininema mesophilum]SDW07224.1 Iron-sulphur cluster biosynthesis [Marininema mesophilum]